MILCEWDASEGHPGQSSIHLYARILSPSFTSVSIFSVWCYSSVSISMVCTPPPPEAMGDGELTITPTLIERKRKFSSYI
jgi:hypothetical protein